MSDHSTHADTAVSGPQLTVQGIRFPLPTQPRYAEGHVLTSVEASVLNQTFAENLRNNWASKLKAKLDIVAKDVPIENVDQSIIDALKSEFLTYAESYTFGYRVPKVQLDPVEHLANKLAKDLVLGALRQKGIEVKSVPAEKLAEYVAGLLEKRPEIRKEATKRLKAQAAMAASILGDLDAAA